MSQDDKFPFWVFASIVFLGVVAIIASGRPQSRMLPIPPEPESQWSESIDHKTYEGQRSSKWPEVRAAFVKKHPVCEACGTSEELNVHHIEPFHLKPELELSLPNLITLCRRDHFYLGHDPDGPWKPAKPNWSKSNPLVKTHAAMVRKGMKY